MSKRSQKRLPWDSGERLQRTVRIRQDAINEDRREVELSFSSETPVRDFFDETVLLHEEGAVDLSRIETTGAALFNHDPGAIVGPIRSVEIDEKDRRGRAVIGFDDTEEGNLAFQRVQSGSLRGVSVGFVINEGQRIGEDESWKSPAGRSFDGPLLIATRWQPMELSLTPVPADHAVGVGRNQPTTTEDEQMKLSPELRAALVARGMPTDSTDEQALEHLNAHPELVTERQDDGNDPAAEPGTTTTQTGTTNVPDGNPDTSVRAERQRIVELGRIARQVDLPQDRLDAWVADGVEPDAARVEALNRFTAQNQPVSTLPRVEVDEEDQRRKYLRYARAALSKRLRLDLDSDAPNDAPDWMNLPQIRRELCRFAGESNALHMNFQQLMTTRGFAHSTDDFDELLENVANKTLQRGYTEAPTTYQVWTRRVDLPDFKQNSHVKFGGVKNFAEVPELMPISEATISDNKETYTLVTMATAFSLSRQALMNDDLDGFGRIIALIGAASARSINKQVYDHLVQASGVGPTMTEGAVALFATTHASGSNYDASAGAPSTANIATGTSKMRRQKDLTGDAILNLVPRWIMVPAALEATTQSVINGIVVPTAEGNALIPLVRNLEVIVEPLLDDATNGTTAWYLIADSTLIDTVVVGRLAGQQAPVIQRNEGTRILGTEWIAYHDSVAQAVDHRGLYRKRGA